MGKEKDFSSNTSIDLANGIIEGVKDLNEDYYSAFLDHMADLLINEQDNERKRAMSKLLGTFTTFWEMEHGTQGFE